MVRIDSGAHEPATPHSPRGEIHDLHADLSESLSVPWKERTRLETLVAAYKEDRSLPEDAKVGKAIVTAVVIEGMWTHIADWVKENTPIPWSDIVNRQMIISETGSLCLSQEFRDLLEEIEERGPEEIEETFSTSNEKFDLRTIRMTEIAQEIGSVLSVVAMGWFHKIMTAPKGEFPLYADALRQQARYVMAAGAASPDEGQGLVLGGLGTGVLFSMGTLFGLLVEQQDRDPQKPLRENFTTIRREAFRLVSAMASSHLNVLGVVSADVDVQQEGMDAFLLEKDWIIRKENGAAWNTERLKAGVAASVRNLPDDEWEVGAATTRTGCPAFAARAPNGNRVILEIFNLCADACEGLLFPRNENPPQVS